MHWERGVLCHYDWRYISHCFIRLFIAATNKLHAHGFTFRKRLGHNYEFPFWNQLPERDMFRFF